jgi:SAM-dependent methyltransferase
VAFALADLVGRTGQVVGLDCDDRMIAAASARVGSRSHVHFTNGNVRTWTCDEPFDAIVGRLILFHLPEPAAIVRHHLAHLRPGALFVAIDYDVGACRTEPPVPLVESYRQLLIDAFRSAGADPMVGTRLASILADAGLAVAQSIGMQGYLAADDPRGAAMLAGIVRSLAPQMAATGIATIADLGLETLHARLAAALQATGSVLLPPTLVGAWGRRPEQR